MLNKISWFIGAFVLAYSFDGIDRCLHRIYFCEAYELTLFIILICVGIALIFIDMEMKSDE